MKINSVSIPIVVTHSTENNMTPTNRTSNSSKLKEVDTPSSGDDSMTSEKPFGENTDTDDSVNDEIMKNSIEQANKTLIMYNKYIEREVHPVTKVVMYKLKDSNTNEVISEFPPKKIQDMIAKMWEIAGIFVDEKA